MPAAASVGAGSDVSIAWSNGQYGPMTASGFWRVGVALSAAAAGEIFSLYVHPRQRRG